MSEILKEKQVRYKNTIDKIAKESFNNEQKILAKKIIDNCQNEDEIDAVFKLICQRVKTGFVFDAAPEVNHDCVALLKLNEKLSINLNAPGVVEHKFIIGENYDALRNLEVAYIDPKNGKGLIDFIYIDPPYNTDKAKEEGNDYKEEVESTKFIYRDKFTRDGFLNLLNERLSIARRLLKDSGVIFVSIDDGEQAYLKVLMDEIFGEDNFVANLPTVMNLKGSQDKFGFAGTHEYTLVYCKNKNYCTFNNFDSEEADEDESNGESEWLEDEYGLYKKGAYMKYTGSTGDRREDRPFMFYPFLIKDGNISTICESEYSKIYDESTSKFDDDYINQITKKYKSDGFDVVWPIREDGSFGRWRWGYTEDNLKKIQTEIIITKTSNGISLYKKQRPTLSDKVTVRPKTLFYKPEYSSGTGAAVLKNILMAKKFNNPKPVELIKDFIKIGTHKNAIVLDFFAGSGTTAQAVMELNHEDGGRRVCILATNNENNIAHDVTFERIFRIINGKGSKGESFKWKYSDINPYLNDNSVAIFDIEYHELKLNDFEKAEKLIPIAKQQISYLNPTFQPRDKFDLYNELAALNPYKKD